MMSRKEKQSVKEFCIQIRLEQGLRRGRENKSIRRRWFSECSIRLDIRKQARVGSWNGKLNGSGGKGNVRKRLNHRLRREIQIVKRRKEKRDR